MATAMASIKSTSNARSVSFVGLTIAIMAVSAWVTVPLGPVPFTLQMFAIVFAVAVLKPREAIAAMAGYLILGRWGCRCSPVCGVVWASWQGLREVFCGARFSVWLQPRRYCTLCAPALALQKGAAPHQSNLPSERDSRWREERCFLSEAPLASSLQV